MIRTAISALQNNPDIKSQNQRLLKNGKSKISTLCTVMRKLMHICLGIINTPKTLSSSGQFIIT